MKWYAAHIVMQIQLKAGRQTELPVWENIYLIESSAPEDAMNKAEAIGLSKEGDHGGSFLWDDQPARWVYRGVRKLLTLSHPGDAENRPIDGCELTFTSYGFASEDDLDRYLEGAETRAKILD